MLRPSAVSHFLPLVDQAAQQLVNRIASRIGTGGEILNLRDDVAKWSLECKFHCKYWDYCYINNSHKFRNVSFIVNTGITAILITVTSSLF
jgi:hypothetical protein